MASAAGGQEESETTKILLELKCAMGSEGQGGGHQINTENKEESRKDAAPGAEWACLLALGLEGQAPSNTGTQLVLLSFERCCSTKEAAD